VMRFLAEFRRRGLPSRIALLSSVVFALAAVLTPIAWSKAGWLGVEAMAVAAGACLAGAVGALAVTGHRSAPKDALVGLLLAMSLRLGLPLAVAAGCLLPGGRLADTGCFAYILVFYPVTLAIETALSLPVLPVVGKVR
jgi:hypothetical protein